LIHTAAGPGLGQQIFDVALVRQHTPESFHTPRLLQPEERKNYSPKQS
jgi:hypothetical protein